MDKVQQVPNKMERICNTHYSEKATMLRVLEKFKNEYDRYSVIYWCTEEYFIYSIELSQN